MKLKMSVFSKSACIVHEYAPNLCVIECTKARAVSRSNLHVRFALRKLGQA